MGGLFQGLHEGLAERLDRKHAQEDQIRKEKRDFYLKGATNPDATDAQQQMAWDEYGKLSGPEAKKGIKQIAPLVNKLKSAFKKGPQQGQQQPQQSQGPASASGQQPMSEQTPNGQPAMDAAAQAKQRFQAGPQGIYPNADQIQQRKVAQEEKEYQGWMKRGREDAGLTGRDLAEYAGSKGTKLPPQERRVADKGVARPGEDPSGKPYDGLWDHTVDPDGTETWAKRPNAAPKSGYTRSVPHSISIQDALATSKQGASYKDADGKDIDLDKLPPTMGLQAMVNGDRIFWVPISPTQSVVEVGNEKYVTTPYNKDVTQAGGGAVSDIGQAKTPTNRTSEQIAVNPVTGEVTKNTLRGSTSPQTPGAKGPAPTPAPARASGPAPQGSSQAPQSAPATPPAARANPDIKGMPSGMYSQMLTRVTPVREAATQVFGDPSQPDVKGLKDYIDLADDPKARERVGTALKLTFDGLNQATSSGAHISADAGPVSVSTGGIGQLFTNLLGVPQETAKQQTKIIQDAINKMTPNEKEYYDSVMSAFSTVVGLRSLTRASAAQSSVSAIERELPIIGVNTTDSKQFADQMQRLAEVVYNGTKGIPPGMIDPKLIDRIKNLPAEMQKRKGPAKAPAAKAPAVGTVDSGYKFKGGDPSKKENWVAVGAR